MRLAEPDAEPGQHVCEQGDRAAWRPRRRCRATVPCNPPGRPSPRPSSLTLEIEVAEQRGQKRTRSNRWSKPTCACGFRYRNDVKMTLCGVRLPICAWARPVTCTSGVLDQHRRARVRSAVEVGHHCRRDIADPGVEHRRAARRSVTVEPGTSGLVQAIDSSVGGRRSQFQIDRQAHRRDAAGAGERHIEQQAGLRGVGLHPDAADGWRRCAPADARRPPAEGWRSAIPGRPASSADRHLVAAAGELGRGGDEVEKAEGEIRLRRAADGRGWP